MLFHTDRSSVSVAVLEKNDSLLLVDKLRSLVYPAERVLGPASEELGADLTFERLSGRGLKYSDSPERYCPLAGDIVICRAVDDAPQSAMRGLLLDVFGRLPFSVLEIDLDSLRHNLESYRSAVGGGVKVAAMVKGDGYGAGSLAVSRVCAEGGVDCLTVTSLAEAAYLRRAGVKEKILVLNFQAEEARAVIELDCEVVVYLDSQADALAAASGRVGAKVRAHLKVDTGLGRYGVPLGEARALLAKWQGNEYLEFIGILTHLSHANEPLADSVNRTQIETFGNLIDSLGPELTPPIVHAANSSAIARYENSWFNMVRPGAALYGVNTYPGIRDKLGTRDVLLWKSVVAQLREVPRGNRVGYGGMFITGRDSRIATAMVGYGDGYPGGMANRARVIVNGHSAPVVGAVSMDCICVDCTELPEDAVFPGDQLLLVGRCPESDAEISLHEAAAAAGCSPYELITRIGPRVSRIYRISA